MIYDAARVRRLCTKFQVNASKNKNFHFGASFFGGALGGGGLDCGQYQILTDLRSGLKNPNINFFLMIGPIGWEEFVIIIIFIYLFTRTNHTHRPEVPDLYGQYMKF